MIPSSFVDLVRKCAVAIVVVIPSVLTGCGGGYSTNSNTLAAISVSSSSASITVGATQQFTATGKDSSGNPVSGVTFTWASSNTSVATINSSGLATGVSAGTTQITASASGVTSVADTLTVMATTVATITISPSSPSVTAGLTQQFAAIAKDGSGNTISGVTFTWASSASNVATINSSGLATAVSAGTTQITASGSGVTSAPDTLTVTAPAVATINVSPSSPSIAVGGTQQFTATAKDANGNAINGVIFTWASSNTSAATIDSTGLASAALAGTTQIMATAGGVTSAEDALTVTPAASVSSIAITVPGPVIFAGGNQEVVTITVTNDQSSDVLTPTATVAGAACTTATCGTFGSITGAAGSGSYTMSYTPPASLAANMPVTLTVSSNLVNSFAATTGFTVHPAGATVVRVNLGSATVFDDTTGNPGAQVSLLGSGYACPSNGSGGTVCGTLGVGATTTGTTSTGTTGIPFTRTILTYTPPSSLPVPPYDRPMVLAMSKGNPLAVASVNLVLSAPAPGNLSIDVNSKPDVALTGGAPLFIPANLTSDSGNGKTMNWTLTAGGASCSPQCGTLGSPMYTWNGTNVSATITYNPPSSVPASPNNQPTLTATSVDNPAATDSFTFSINDGTCGTGNNGLLNGQYGFLLKGGAAAGGYFTLIGSFTADGNGHVTGGALDRNATTGSITGLSVVSAGSSYSIGADGRGCLTLANSNGGSANYRIALGSLSAGIATKGRMIRFDDFTGSGTRMSGVLMRQDPTSFSPGQFTGTHVFGFTGVDAGGGRLAGAGVLSSDGAGNLTSISEDVNDNGSPSGNITGATGSYVLGVNAANGRGTISVTQAAQNGGGTQNSVVYMISSAEALFMSTDTLSSNAGVLSGELKAQTGPFSATSLDGAGYVFYETGIDPNGANKVVIAQATVGSNGAATITADTNDNGIENEVSDAETITISSNGRAAITANSGSGNATIVYLADSSSGFLVGTGAADGFGFLQKQSATSFTNATFSGAYFFGGDAPTTASSYDSGTASLNGSGSSNGSDDSASPAAPAGSGLLIGSQGGSGGGGTYSFSATSTPPGRGNVGPNTVAYAVSPTLVIFINTSGAAELFIAQQ